LFAKYIHLVDKERNDFSKNAQTDYFTPGFNLHLHRGQHFAEIGTFLGKRAFAVMQNGFAIQHHAMEFTQTYMVAFGKLFDNYAIRLRYSYLKANELPSRNNGVTVNNFALVYHYHFQK
jgi:hypothetical protein